MEKHIKIFVFLGNNTVRGKALGSFRSEEELNKYIFSAPRYPFINNSGREIKVGEEVMGELCFKDPDRMDSNDCMPFVRSVSQPEKEQPEGEMPKTIKNKIAEEAEWRSTNGHGGVDEITRDNFIIAAEYGYLLASQPPSHQSEGKERAFSLQEILHYGAVCAVKGRDMKPVEYFKEKFSVDITLESQPPSSIKAEQQDEKEIEAITFLDSIRDYERESGNHICYDERTSKELYDIFKLNNL